MTISYDVADGQRTNRAGEPQVLGPDAKRVMHDLSAQRQQPLRADLP